MAEGLSKFSPNARHPEVTVTAPTLAPTELAELADLAQPAWLWEPCEVSLLWANRAGLALWGADTIEHLQAIGIDRSMPAVARLRSLSVVLAPGASDIQTLVFWLPSGMHNLACSCRKMRFGNAVGALLVQVAGMPDGSAPVLVLGADAKAARSLNGHAIGSEPARGAASAMPAKIHPAVAPEDAATLAEIARLVRRSGAADAPAAAPPPQGQGLGLGQGLGGGAANGADAELLGRLSHELRTPLNAIIGYAELMRAQQHGRLGSSKYHDFAGTILESARHCLDLANDLVHAAGPDGGQRPLDFSEVDVNEAVRACLGIVAPIAGTAGVALADDLALDLPHAVLDRRSLAQILLNLVGNAIKYTPSGGEVAVTTRYDVGSGLRVIVADTGRGMSLEALGRARGLPAGAAAQGPARSGLGLPISRELAAANGGRIDLESRPGAGTVATLALPMSRLVLL